MKKVLDLGEQPVPNTLLDSPLESYDTYNLSFGFDEYYALGGLVENIPSHLMYNNSYPYSASASVPTVEHFKQTSKDLIDMIHPSSVLEIGSNDGSFIKNFEPNVVLAIEPCDNFAERTNEDGYKTICDGWSLELAKSLPKFDLVFAANCITHIENLEDSFKALAEVVSDNGVIVLEEPWLYRVLSSVAYDQIYFEHSYIFSASSVSRLAESVGLHLHMVDKLPSVHGGSLRYYLGKSKLESFKATNFSAAFRMRAHQILEFEEHYGLTTLSKFNEFAENVEQSKINLRKLISEINSKEGTNIIGYGATAKLVTVFNYCGLGDGDSYKISCISDTTEAKQGKFSPGSGVHIVSPLDLGSSDCSVTHAFLGAWNFSSDIMSNEQKFINRGGQFITHVPEVKILRGGE